MNPVSGHYGGNFNVTYITMWYCFVGWTVLKQFLVIGFGFLDVWRQKVNKHVVQLIALIILDVISLLWCKRFKAIHSSYFLYDLSTRHLHLVIVLNRSVLSYIETHLRVESHYVSLYDAFFGQNLPLLKKWHHLEKGKSNFIIKLIQIYLCKTKLLSFLPYRKKSFLNGNL